MKKWIAIVAVTALCLGGFMVANEKSVQNAFLDDQGPHFIIVT